MRKLKLLSLLMLLFVGVTSIWADSVTFDYLDYKGKGTSSSGSDYTMSDKADVSIGDTKFFGNNSQAHFYANGVTTVTPASGVTITKIVINATEAKYNGYQSSGTMTWSTGSSSANDAVVTWTGSATSAFTLSHNKQIRWTSIVVTYSKASSCDKKVTISKGEPSNGDFTLSKTGAQETCDAAVSIVVTPTPAEHYKVTGVTAPNSSSITGPADGKYTVTYAQNTNAASEINVTFALKDQHTVTWDNNGVTSTSQVYDGEKPVFPTPAPTSCDATSTTFIGWATEAWAGKLANLTGKTVYTTADEMPAVTGAVTYYAVFAKVSGGAAGWVLTDIADITASDVFVFADASNYAMTNDNGTSSAPAAVAITVSDGKVTSAVADKLKWQLSGNATDGYTFYPNGSTTTWLYCNTTAESGSNNNMRVGTGDRKVFVIDGSGYLVTSDDNKARYMSCYNNQDFRGYINTDLAITPKLYKYSAGSVSDYMTTCAAAGQCAAPTFSVAGGTYNAAQSVELSCETDGATIHYTTSGDAPTSSSATYSSAIAVNENMTIKAIAVKGGSTDSEIAEAVYVLKPAIPEIAGSASFVGATNVTITCETEGVEIRYTTNGDAPTASSTLYSAPFEINASCTVKAIAVKTNWTSSDAASKEFTKHVPLTTMDEIFSAASSAGNYYITFSNAWVVTGVSTNGKTVYISDGTKGMILYNNSANMELAVGNTLSGTVQRSLTLYNGAAELTGFTTEGLTKGTADLPAVQVLDAAGIEALSGVNTGSLIKISGAATQSETKYYVAGVQLYNALSTAYTNPTAGKNYYVTGVYAQYNTTKEVLPRSAADIEEMKYQLNYILPASGTLSIKQNETLVNSGTKWVEGTKFTLSSTAPSNEYQDGVYTVTDWMEPANDFTADVLSGNTLTMPKYNVIVTVAFPEKTAAPISWSNSGEAVNVTLGDTYVLPTLVNSENLDVTCSVSGTEGAATVTDAGVVTILKAGTVTVTATYTATSTGAYKTTAVSYTLTIATPASYSLKNNWNYGDWNWLETTYAGDGKWQLANVVFGGTGVNWRQGDTGDGTWVALADIAGAEIGALDTVTLVLDPSAGTVTATLVGKYVAPDFYITGTAVGGWATTQQAVKGESYTIKDLEPGSYQLKITLDGTWGTAKGFSNLTASEMIAGLTADGSDNICFTLKTTSDVIVTYTGEVFKLEGNFLLQPVIVKGAWDSWAEHEMTTLSDDKKSVSITMPLAAAENVEFGIDVDGGFRANGYNYHREFTGATGITGNTGNMKLTSDIAGDYTFTWIFGTNGLNITFPMVEAGLSWGVDAATAYTVGKEYELPTLSNPNNLENVSYESSAPAVATIAADGTITLVGTGSTVITATSEATSVYKAGVATYTLTVSAPTSVVVTGEAEKDAYEAGETFSFAGLGAKAVYAENDEYTIPANEITWTNSLTDNKVNAAGDVTVTAEWRGLSDNKVVTVSLLTHELTFTAPTNGTLVVEYNDAEVETGEHFLKGDVLTITATPASIDYKLASLTVNGEAFTSGSTYTVGTEDIAIVASFTKKPEPTLSWSIDPNNPKNIYLSGRDEDNEFPTAINPLGLPLTYGSLNGSVAEIDAEGNFILHEAGFASMYFNFAGNETYCSVHREYPLTVYALDRIEIGGEATATEYEAGDAFDRSGLTATAVYKVGVFTENYDVTTKATWNAAPATIAANTNQVSVTAAWNGKTSAAEEVAVTVKTHKVTFKDYDEDYYVYLSVWNGETRISSGDEFAKGTVLTVEVELESADYVLATLTANTTDIKATKQFTIGEVDVTIEATSESKPLAPISWSAESASIAMNGDVATLPTLVNEQGLTIMYMSNNEEAATIDENTGVITLVGAGVTTITAQSIATPEGAYRTTFATYTLTVVAIPTALDNAEAGEKAQKIMLNNQLFILRGGKMYDAQGKLVK